MAGEQVSYTHLAEEDGESLLRSDGGEFLVAIILEGTTVISEITSRDDIPESVDAEPISYEQNTSRRA